MKNFLAVYTGSATSREKSNWDLILPHFPGHLDMRLNSSIEVFYEEQES